MCCSGIDPLVVAVTVYLVSTSSENKICLLKDEILTDGKWSIGTETYVKQALERVCILLGHQELGKEKTPMSSTFHPELDELPPLDCEKYRLYQQLVGIAQWFITCGKFNLCYAISSLSRYSLAPWENHLKWLERVFKYINKNKALAIWIDPAN